MATLGAAIVPLLAAAPAHANQPPVMSPDFYRVATGWTTTPVLTVPAPGVLANDHDPDGDPITAALLSGTTNGTLDLRRSGRFTYTPNPGFVGLDQFSYSARDDPDGVFNCCGHVYIGVTAPAVAADDAYAALSGVQRRVRAPDGVLANDLGAERARPVSQPAHGTLGMGKLGGFAYTADPGFVGTDSFRYKATVAGEPPSLATVSLRVKASNSPPVANPDDYTTPEDTLLSIAAPGVLGNDVDADGDPLTAEIVSRPFGEDFALDLDGSFEYVPPSNYDSPVSFTYRISDGLVRSPPTTVTIEIPAVDDSPFAEDDFYALGGASRLDIPAPGVLANDYDEVEGDALSARLRVKPGKGTVTLRANGSFTYVRTPGTQGVDSFSYRVRDSGGAVGNIAFVTIDP